MSCDGLGDDSLANVDQKLRKAGSKSGVGLECGQGSCCAERRQNLKQQISTLCHKETIRLLRLRYEDNQLVCFGREVP